MSATLEQRLIEPIVNLTLGLMSREGLKALP